MVPTTGEGVLPSTAFTVYTTWAAAAKNQEEKPSGPSRGWRCPDLAARTHMIVVEDQGREDAGVTEGLDVGEVRPSYGQICRSRRR